MNADKSNPLKILKIAMQFLKKSRLIKILAAVLSIVLTVVFSYLLYALEYHYTLDKNDLSTAITEFTIPFEPSFDACVLEMQAVGSTLIVSFKDQAHVGNYGVAILVKGVNQRYRIIRTQIKASEYSSVVQFFPLKIRNKQYYAVCGYNLTTDTRFYGLDYCAYKNPGNLTNDRVTQAIQFDIKNPQFLDIYPANELDDRVVKESSQTLYDYRLLGTSLYDANGYETTENFKNENLIVQTHSGANKAELFLLYVYIAIIMGIGIGITRYFLTSNSILLQTNIRNEAQNE